MRTSSAQAATEQTRLSRNSAQRTRGAADRVLFSSTLQPRAAAGALNGTCPEELLTVIWRTQRARRARPRSVFRDFLQSQEIR
jgi:hypothetical protein